MGKQADAAMGDGALPLWQSLTTVEVADLVARDPVAVLPLAAIEQHGPHLPLSTDLDIGLGLLEEALRHLPDDLPAVVLPPQAVGTSAEHLSFPGTLSLTADVLTEVVCGIGSALAEAGVRRLVISNSHGGNLGFLEEAGLRLRREEGMLVARATYFRFPRPDAVELPEVEWRDGFHGGAVETAMMLHLRPDLVRAEAIENHPSIVAELEGKLRRLRPEGEAPFSWLAEDLNASGVVGDARLANAEDGRRLVEHYARVMAEVIEDARAFPLDRLG
jgi:creatinine amidohydrolase